MKYVFMVLATTLALAGAARADTFESRWPETSAVECNLGPGKHDKRVQLAQVSSTEKTTDIKTSAPVTSTTVVKGGTIAAQIIEWLQAAFGLAIGTLLTALVYRGLGWMGIQVTDQQKAQLQGIVVNGLNDAAAKAETSLRGTTVLDVNVKNQIVSDAIDYTQRHGSETIKALGLDPNSGEAVEAIKARIETALNDPKTPTPPALTPVSAQPLAPGAAA